MQLIVHCKLKLYVIGKAYTLNRADIYIEDVTMEMVSEICILDSDLVVC